MRKQFESSPNSGRWSADGLSGGMLRQITRLLYVRVAIDFTGSYGAGSHFPETTPQGRDDADLYICGPWSGAWQSPILEFSEGQHLIAIRPPVYLSDNFCAS